MARDLDVTLLRAFLAVVDTGSVTAAAKLLNRTQAAVSQQIKRLEETLETELFKRSGRAVRLSSGGEVLLAQARRIVALNDEIYGMMTTPSFNGTVRLGIPMDVVPTYAPSILKRFAQAWPKVNVELVSRNSVDLLKMLDDGELDVALTTEFSVLRPGGEILRQDQLVWVSAPDADLAHLNPLPLSIGSPDCRFRPVVLDTLRDAGRDWRFVFEIHNQEALNAVVAAGLAVNALLQDSVPSDLRILGPESGLPTLPKCGINMYLPAGGGTELARALADQIRSDFAYRFGPYQPDVPISVAAE
jgi:DNA-binding transcriptional LysR family regulator